MSNMRGFDAAQREYDNRTPPDDGPSECPDCKGGYRYTTDDAENEHEIKCETCEGLGLIDENGQPFNPNAKAEAEYERGDYLRQREKDDRLTGDVGRDEE